MKNIVTALVLLLAFSAHGQQTGARVFVEKHTHNFGLIKEVDGLVSYDFQLKNIGDSPLIINRVNTSCGCAVSEWPKKPILPNETFTVKATYNPKDRPGNFTQNITVFSNAAPSGTVLVIRGSVEARLQTAEDMYRKRMGNLGLSNSHLSFGKITEKERASASLDIYNFGDEPITLSFDRVPKHIQAETKPKTLKPQEAGKLDVSFNAKQIDDWGFIINRLVILVNNERPQGNILSISATIEEDFSQLNEKQKALAAEITFAEITKDFGVIDEGETIKHSFAFTNTGKSELIIRKIKASCGCTTIEPTNTIIKPGETGEIFASFRTTGYSGRQSKTITVITNDPTKQTVVLRLTGTVIKKGAR